MGYLSNNDILDLTQNMNPTTLWVGIAINIIFIVVGSLYF